MARCWVHNLCPQFAERNSKRYSKKDLLYGTIQLFFNYKTYNGGFFKNKKYVGNNKWTVCLRRGQGCDTLTTSAPPYKSDKEGNANFLMCGISESSTLC